MLNQLASQLGQVGQQLWTTELPFLSSLSLAQAANLEQAFQTEVTNQIEHWSDTLQQDRGRFHHGAGPGQPAGAGPGRQPFERSTSSSIRRPTP